MVTEFTERAIVYVSYFLCELNEFGKINVTEKRRTSASKKYMKKHGGLSVGLLIPALEALETSRGGEACLRRPRRLTRLDGWICGGTMVHRLSRSGGCEISPKRNF